MLPPINWETGDSKFKLVLPVHLFGEIGRGGGTNEGIPGIFEGDICNGGSIVPGGDGGGGAPGGAASTSTNSLRFTDCPPFSVRPETGGGSNCSGGGGGGGKEGNFDNKPRGVQLFAPRPILSSNSTGGGNDDAVCGRPNRPGADTPGGNNWAPGGKPAGPGMYVGGPGGRAVELDKLAFPLGVVD